jgi:hypothetical protein
VLGFGVLGFEFSDFVPVAIEQALVHLKLLLLLETLLYLVFLELGGRDCPRLLLSQLYCAWLQLYALEVVQLARLQFHGFVFFDLAKELL